MNSELLGIILVVGCGVAFLLVAAAVWAVWRMTWAHEQILQRVSRIERLVEEHVRGAPPGGAGDR